VKIKKLKIYIIFLIMVAGFAEYVIAQEKDSFNVNRSITTNAKKVGEKNIINYKVLKNTEAFYSIEQEIDYDLPFPDLKIFDDGSCVLINSFDASLTFYDNRGIKILKSDIFKETNIAYERAIYAAVSGASLAVTVSQPEFEHAIVQIYNKNGQKVIDWQLPEKNINGITLSKSDDLLAISSYGWKNDQLDKTTRFYDINGYELVKIPVNFLNGRFFNNGNEFFGNTKNKWFVYNLLEDRLNFENEISKEKMILTADIFDSQLVIVLAKKPLLKEGKWYYKNPEFHFYNFKGEIVQEHNEECEPFYQFELVINVTNMEFKTENNNINLSSQ